jgi:membrane-bound lytic murein transglycosylase B
VIRRLIILAALLCSVSAYALDVERPAVKSFVARLSTEHGFEPRAVNAVLAKAELQPSVLDAMSRPAERALLWYEYRDRFIIEQRVKEGIQFWERHRELLEQIERARGVPAEYLVAILGVETYYGRITGKYRVLDALTTLAFDYPPRSEYFTQELEQFFLLTREDSVDPLTALGSYAGAMGPPQFMPRSIRKFAVDGDGDGRRDLWADWEDILNSIANYFLVHGWKPGDPVIAPARIDQSRAHDLDPRKLALNETVGSLRDKGVLFETTLPPNAPALLLAPDLRDSVFFRVGFNNFYVITRYNRSPLYAMAVHDLATELLARVYSDDATD